MSGARSFPLFIYGTLRPGEALQDLALAAANSSQPFRRAYLPGHALYWNWSKSYPYMAKTSDPADVVRGTWFVADEGWALQRIVDLERGAGYDLTAVKPMLGRTGELPVAMAFTVPLSRLEFYGSERMPQNEDAGYRGLVYDWSVSSKLPEPPVAGVEEIETFGRIHLDK